MRSRVVPSRKSLGQRVTRIASPLLQIAAAAQLYTLDRERHAELLAEAFYEGLVLGGPVAEPVIDMER